MNVIRQDARNKPIVVVVTAHGRQELEYVAGDRLIDVLIRHQIPWSAVSVYSVAESGSPPVLAACLGSRIADYPAKELLLYFNRNVNPFTFLVDRLKLAGEPPPASPATEYIYQAYDNTRSSVDVYLKTLTPEECRVIIVDRVREVVVAALPSGGDLVVGVSGGGDSNALLYALANAQHENLTIHPVIIKGIPDWDAGVDRAAEICRTYGLTLTIIEEPEVKDLLGMTHGAPSLLDRFEREFPGDDFEFLGTLLIRLALSRHAQKVGTPYITTGLNLEDVLCEALYRLSNGLPPASYPQRVIGDTTLVFPLWLCPKRIIDGCFPRASWENYEARYPCFSVGRNLYYSAIYSIQSAFPGLVEHLVKGIAEVSRANPVTYKIDQQLGFHVERFVPLALARKFGRMVSGAAV